MRSAAIVKSVRKRFVGRLAMTSAIGIAVLVAGGVFVELATRTGWNAQLAYAIQLLVAIGVSFYLNNRFTWGDRKGVYWRKKAIKFAVGKGLIFLLGNLVLFPFGLSLYQGLTALVEQVSPQLTLVIGILSEALFAYLFSTGITMVVGFFYNEWYVFTER